MGWNFFKRKGKRFVRFADAPPEMIEAPPVGFRVNNGNFQTTVTRSEEKDDGWLIEWKREPISGDEAKQSEI